MKVENFYNLLCNRIPLILTLNSHVLNKITNIYSTNKLINEETFLDDVNANIIILQVRLSHRATSMQHWRTLLQFYRM